MKKSQLTTFVNRKFSERMDDVKKEINANRRKEFVETFDSYREWMLQSAQENTEHLRRLEAIDKLHTNGKSITSTKTTAQALQGLVASYFGWFDQQKVRDAFGTLEEFKNLKPEDISDEVMNIIMSNHTNIWPADKELIDLRKKKEQVREEFNKLMTQLKTISWPKTAYKMLLQQGFTAEEIAPFIEEENVTGTNGVAIVKLNTVLLTGKEEANDED